MLSDVYDIPEEVARRPHSRAFEQFLQTWFESDGDLEDSAGGTNWGAIYGLALSVAVSASFWAGVAWIVARVWR